jgi:hypothetical protein
MTKKKDKTKFPRDNILFAKHIYEFMNRNISSKETKEFIVERMASCYDAFPLQKIEDHKAYIQWLGVHNEG